MTVIHPRTVHEARAYEGEFRAGGTDVEARRRIGLTQPVTIDLRAVPGLSGIEHRPDATVIGSMTRLSALIDELATTHPAIALTVAGLASPEIRAVGTVGGNLLQQTRCWYYRTGDIECHKTGGDGCPARSGLHHFGNVFDTSSCVAPHPSSLAMALLLYDADVVIHPDATRSLTDLYDPVDPGAEHTLDPHEVLVSVALPRPTEGESGAYHRAIARSHAEWPLVEAACRLVVRDGRIALARVAAGGVAPAPLRLKAVEDRLQDASADSESLAEAAGLSRHGSRPAPQAAYKLALLEGVVLQVLEDAVGRAAVVEGAFGERPL
jgi:xanthine dehydrogenase YagS FAD-binding subunit